MERSAGQSNDEWFAEHVMELVEKYPNQWVGISGGKVICSSASKWGAKSAAKKAAGGQDYSLYFIEPSMLQMGFARSKAPPQEPPK